MDTGFWTLNCLQCQATFTVELFAGQDILDYTRNSICPHCQKRPADVTGKEALGSWHHVVGFHSEKAEAPTVKSNEDVAADLKAMTLLHAVGIRCNQTGNDYAECLAELVATAIAITHADKGNMQVFDHQTGTLRVAAHHGFEPPFLKFFSSVGQEDSAACSAALRSRERVVIEDILMSEVFVGQPSLEVLLNAGVRAVQSTPLLSGAGNVHGMISTHFKAPHRPRKRELELMDLLAGMASNYLERNRPR